jgi:hypothetical protein
MQDEGMQHAMTVGAVTWDITSWPPIDEKTRPFGQRLLDWAADGNGAGPRLCLVRGAEGSGKSRLLAWFLAGTIDRPGITVHATVPSEGLTAESFAWELGRQLGYGPLSPVRLLDQVPWTSGLCCSSYPICTGPGRDPRICRRERPRPWSPRCWSRC